MSQGITIHPLEKSQKIVKIPGKSRKNQRNSQKAIEIPGIMPPKHKEPSSSDDLSSHMESIQQSLQR